MLVNSTPSDKDIRAKVIEALQRYGYKQVDVARETGIYKIKSNK